MWAHFSSHFRMKPYYVYPRLVWWLVVASPIYTWLYTICQSYVDCLNARDSHGSPTAPCEPQPSMMTVPGCTPSQRPWRMRRCLLASSTKFESWTSHASIVILACSLTHASSTNCLAGLTSMACLRFVRQVTSRGISACSMRTTPKRHDIVFR